MPFPPTFREALSLQMGAQRSKGAALLFESSWKKPYSTRGVRALLARYAHKAGLEHNMPPHRLRHFLFTWLKGEVASLGDPAEGVAGMAEAWRAGRFTVSADAGPSLFRAGGGGGKAGSAVV